MYSDQILSVFQLYFSDISEKKIGRIVQIIKREFINHCTRVYIYRPETRTTDQPTSRVTIILQIINFPQEFTINEQKYPSLI